MKRKREQTICEWAGVKPSKPKPGSKLGIALGTIGKKPINGLRHQPEKGTSGWYIWCGEEFSDDENFFSPLHIEHIREHLPEVIEYLDLPPGYRFLIDGKNYEDVWFDDTGSVWFIVGGGFFEELLESLRLQPDIDILVPQDSIKSISPNEVKIKYTKDQLKTTAKMVYEKIQHEIMEQGAFALR